MRTTVLLGALLAASGCQDKASPAATKPAASSPSAGQASPSVSTAAASAPAGSQYAVTNCSNPFGATVNATGTLTNTAKTGTKFHISVVYDMNGGTTETGDDDESVAAGQTVKWSVAGVGATSNYAGTCHVASVTSRVDPSLLMATPTPVSAIDLPGAADFIGTIRESGIDLYVNLSDEQIANAGEGNCGSLRGLSFDNMVARKTSAEFYPESKVQAELELRASIKAFCPELAK